MLLHYLHQLWVEERGQDLIEYSLVIAFMVFVLFGLVGLLSPYINGMWMNGNSRLTDANTTAS